MTPAKPCGTIPLILPKRTRPLPTVYPKFLHSQPTCPEFQVFTPSKDDSSILCPQDELADCKHIWRSHSFSVDRLVTALNVR
jgi:hypothetical protein